jgi:hypothetical protein
MQVMHHSNIWQVAGVKVTHYYPSDNTEIIAGQYY